MIDLKGTALAQYAIVPPSRPLSTSSNDPAYKARQVMREATQTQMEAVRADLEGQPFSPTKANGSELERFVRWYYQTTEGFECTPRYIHKPLLGGAVVVTSLQDVHDFLNVLLQEINKGKLDAAMTEIREARQGRMEAKRAGFANEAPNSPAAEPVPAAVPQPDTETSHKRKGKASV